MRICRDCGKPIDMHRGFFWKKIYDTEKRCYIIEFYCYRCGRSRLDERNSFNLSTDASFGGQHEQ